MADIIAFDLNKTLIKQNSWYDLNLAMGISAEEDERLYRLGPEGEGVITYAEWIGQLAKLMVGRGKASRQNIETVLLDYTYLDGAKETITQLKQRKDTAIGLITGALSPVAEQVAEELELDFVYSNASMEFDEKDMLKAIILKGEDFAYKGTVVSQLRNNYPYVENFYYVADGDNDEGIFEITKGVMVTPDPNMHEAWKSQAMASGHEFSAHRAARAAWKIVDSIIAVPAALDFSD